MKQNKTFKTFISKNFNQIALYNYYKSLCRNNYLKYLKSGNFVTYKKYLYSYRGLINAKWVANKRSIPPINFSETITKMKDIIPKEIIKELEKIIKLKSQGREKEIIKNIVKMDNYIEKFLKDDSEAPKEKPHVTLNDLNEELRKIVLK
jgi:predicted nucleotidyltransferase